MKMLNIIDTRPRYNEHTFDVTHYTFFINAIGKLYEIVATTFFCEKGKAKIWGGSPDCNKGCDLLNAANDATEIDLRHPLKHLALNNPEQFKALYYTLKENDPKMFPIIQSVLEEVQALFDFS